jgi:hypothetical protein
MTRIKISKSDLIEDQSGVVLSGESVISSKTWSNLSIKHKDEKSLIDKLKINDKRSKSWVEMF